MLHIVNKSPFEKDSLQTCLAYAQAGDALLLIEDGVYACLAGGEHANWVEGARVEVFALAPDLRARGIESARCIEAVRETDYAGFVELCVRHNPVKSWL